MRAEPNPKGTPSLQLFPKWPTPSLNNGKIAPSLNRTSASHSLAWRKLRQPSHSSNFSTLEQISTGNNPRHGNARRGLLVNYRDRSDPTPIPGLGTIEQKSSLLRKKATYLFAPFARFTRRELLGPALRPSTFSSCAHRSLTPLRVTTHAAIMGMPCPQASEVDVLANAEYG
jgi:hypothetical protein